MTQNLEHPLKTPPGVSVEFARIGAFEYKIQASRKVSPHSVLNLNRSLPVSSNNTSNNPVSFG